MFFFFGFLGRTGEAFFRFLGEGGFEKEMFEKKGEMEKSESVDLCRAREKPQDACMWFFSHPGSWVGK